MAELAQPNDDNLIRGVDPDHVYYWRSRFKLEVAQALYKLMRSQGVKRNELAARVNKPKSYISRVLGGDHNFRLDTVSDLFAALGRFPHLVLGTEPEEMRFAVDEGSGVEITEIAQDVVKIVEISAESTREYFGGSFTQIAGNISEFSITSANQGKDHYRRAGTIRRSVRRKHSRVVD